MSRAETASGRLNYASREDSLPAAPIPAVRNTTVSIDADGAANGSKFSSLVVLSGVTTNLANLTSSGNIDATPEAD